MADFKMWDFYQDSQQQTSSPTTYSNTSSGNIFDSVTSTANSWLDSLGNTFVKYTDLKTQYEKAKIINDEATQREYENITQKTNQSLGNTISSNQNLIIYGGVALVGAFLIFGKGK